MSKTCRSFDIIEYLKNGGYTLSDIIRLLKLLEYLNNQEYSLDDLKLAIDTWSSSYQSKNANTLAIISRIAQILYDLGVVSDPDGYAYCIDAVRLAYEDKSFLKGDLKCLYEKIANMHKVTCSKVNSGLRTVIEIIFTKTPESVYRKYFGDIVLKKTYYISTRNFVKILSEYLHSED